MGNEEMEKSQERREGAKNMLNGVGGLNVWWSLVVHPDESRNPLEEKGRKTKKKRQPEREKVLFISLSRKKKKKAGTADPNVVWSVTN